MFGGGYWNTYGSPDDHLIKEREPPPRPIDLEFPQYVPKLNVHPLTHELSGKIQRKICQTRSFNAIGDDDLEQFNICFEPNVPLATLVPDHAFPQRPFLYDDDLQSMLDEISIDNQDAFREVLRMPPREGHQKPRLAYARNLFGSLEDIHRYFDQSQDNYYRVPVNKSAADISESDEAATSGEHEVQNGTKEVYRGYRISNAENMGAGSRISMVKNLLKMVMHKFQCRDHEPIPQPREKLTIRGVKLQSIQYQFCVARIPTEMKQARARLVEGPIMAVHIRDELRFKVKDRLFTPEKTGFVGERFDLLREIGCMIILAMQRSRETPNADQKSETSEPWWVANARWGGGPTKWGQLSYEVFEDEDPSLSPAEELFRDQKRKKEEEDKLRAAEEAAKVQEADSIKIDDLIAKPADTTVKSVVEEINSRRKKLRSSSHETVEVRDGRRVMFVPPARKRWYKDWQQLRPNASGRDKRIISRKVGNEDEQNPGFDEIYLLTSCNHHVAISKMRVHSKYLGWLQNGTPVDSLDDDPNNNPAVLHVKRSEWYDMFDVEARKEFLVQLWRLMSWLNRNEVPEAEHEKMREKAKETTQVKSGE